MRLVCSLPDEIFTLWLFKHTNTTGFTSCLATCWHPSPQSANIWQLHPCHKNQHGETQSWLHADELPPSSPPPSPPPGPPPCLLHQHLITDQLCPKSGSGPNQDNHCPPGSLQFFHLRKESVYNFQNNSSKYWTTFLAKLKTLYIDIFGLIFWLILMYTLLNN